jgi:predicted nucleic acid-binding protein
MNGRYLLDTNIVIALFANDAAVIDHLRLAQAIFIPSIVVGELYFGAYRSTVRLFPSVQLSEPIRLKVPAHRAGRHIP